MSAIMKTIFITVLLCIKLVAAQDAATVGASSSASTGLFGGFGSSLGTSLTSFLPSFPTLPSLSVGAIPCVGLSTLSTGSCLAADACDLTGGSSDSGCLTGSQVCCIAPMKCGSAIAGTDAWITNDEYPNVTIAQQNCVYTITKASPLIAQLKIELDSVTLAGASNGQCSDDRLMVEGVQGINVFPLCGTSAGSHIILPFSGNSIALRVIVSGAGNVQRKWRIHVTQVANNAAAIAPAGCTQVFSSDGTLSSLNAGVGGIKYAICFQKAPGTCGLRIDASSLLQTSASLAALGQPLLGLTNTIEGDTVNGLPASTVRVRRQEPNLCHEYIFLAPSTLVCVEAGKYQGPAEIVLTGSPLVAYIESSSSAAPGNNWRLPFSFIPC